MRNRIPKAAEDYKKEYYGRHDNAGAFYCSDYYEVLEAAENGGGRSGHPLQCSTHSPRSGLYDRLQEGTAGQQEAQGEPVEEEPTEAQAAIMLFELWQDGLIAGTMPDCKRYEADFMGFYKEICAGKHAPFYFMFMGFVGGMDFINKLDSMKEAAGQQEE